MLRRTVLLLLFPLAAAKSFGEADANALWSAKVQPLFDLHCVKCHGPIEQKNGLELDTPQAVLKGSEDGAVIVPGKPEESLLYQNLAPKADPHMPPKKQLSESERQAVREWILAMATASTEIEAKPKAARQFDSIQSAIDTLIAEGWAQRQVQPAAAADERAWCRRVYLDLAGRIPTRTELDEFLEAPAE